VTALEVDQGLVERLSRPEPRLPAIQGWLLNEVWTEAALAAAGGSPRQYLVQGEAAVNDLEKLLTAAARSLSDELASLPGPALTIGRFFEENPRSAGVVFDGCSLREIPRLLQLAKASGREVLELGCGRAAVPSETENFVAERLGLGLPDVGPSQLRARAELRQRNVRYYYFSQPGEHQTIEDGDENVLLWSRYPDQRYTDSTAVNEGFFEGLWDGFEPAWKRSVGAVPATRTVLVTSDHGYVFLGQGLSDRSLDGVDRALEGKRFRFFSDGEAIPAAGRGLWVDSRRRLAVLAGRGHNRPQAPSASQSLYRHGGLTLMEMLTPWIVLGPVRV
jgi:hypothetical protein